MGGLGAPVGLYLAAAGVGKLTIYDGDTVDLTNLQRQVIFTMADIGQSKAQAAKRHLLALNPDICIDAVAEHFSLSSARNDFSDVDLVLDCSDNFSTRYLINDFCLDKKLPWVYASVHQYAGQCALFVPGGACFRCVFPQAPDNPEDCNSAGVMGVLPGLMGLMQSSEALKYLAGQAAALSNQLLLFDAAQLSMQRIRLSADSDCRCQQHGVSALSGDYAFACDSNVQDALEVSPEVFNRLRDQKNHTVLDVREIPERTSFHIGGEHIPMGDVAQCANQLAKHSTILCYCQSGKRSRAVAEELSAMGYNALSVQGGLAAWLKAQS